MGSLPFALALSDWSGRMTYIATFREFADLLTFHAAWSEQVEEPTRREALLVHDTGRMIRTARPEHAARLAPTHTGA